MPNVTVEMEAPFAQQHLREFIQKGVHLMTGSKQLARFGLFYLKEAVLNVLFNAVQTDIRELRNRQISERLGIERSTYDTAYYPIVRGVLDELLKEKRVIKCSKSKTWRITEAEAQRRADP